MRGSGHFRLGRLSLCVFLNHGNNHRAREQGLEILLSLHERCFVPLISVGPRRRRLQGTVCHYDNTEAKMSNSSAPTILHTFKCHLCKGFRGQTHIGFRASLLASLSLFNNLTAQNKYISIQRCTIIFGHRRIGVAVGEGDATPAAIDNVREACQRR